MGKLLNSIKPWVAKNKPEILMSLGLSGLTFAAIWNVKATINAVHLVEQKKEELNTTKLTPKDTFKTVWKCYIPSAVSFVLSVPCVVAGNRVSNKRNAALAAAYSISETALNEYINKTKEIVGEEKSKEIQSSINQDKVNASPQTSLVVAEDECLIMESYSGRIFKSNVNKVQELANELNAQAINGNDTISLSEWYERLGLDCTADSDYYGWCIYNGRDGLIDIDWDTCMTKDNKPCLVINYRSLPKKI